MTDLSSRLRALFASPHIRTVASLAPLGVVASGAGLVIGAAVANPALAAAGLGAVLTSFATNVMSSVVYDIVKPDLDEGERERKIAQGLKDRDPGVIRLVAEALIAAGPELAHALPDATRAELIAALGQGMRESGGSLAAITTQYTAALGQPQTDWAALQVELRRAISVEQTISIGEEGINERSGQHIERPDGPVKQSIDIARGGKNIDSGQVVIGGGGRTLDQRGLLGGRGDDATTDQQHLRRLRGTHKRRLRELEAQAAQKGQNTPPEIAIEIDDLRAEIERLDRLLVE